MHKLRKIIQKTGFDIHRHRNEPDRLNWLTEHNISSIFDIGANTGQFAKEIRQALPGAKIYSFEPLKDCFQELKKNMSGDMYFEAFNCALGERSETTTINRSSYSLSSSLRPMADSHKELFPHTKSMTKETINVRTLDTVFSELNPKPNTLIKIDTQGYEDKVITGGITALQSAEVVLIEASYIELYEGQPLFKDIYQKLTGLGFTYQGSLHQKLNNKTGEVIFEDSIYART